MRYTRLMDDFSSANGDIPVLAYADDASRKSSKRWWHITDLEAALLLGLAGLASLIVMPRLLQRSRCCCYSKTKLAEAAVKPLGAISTALKNFKFDHGHYPSQLNELLRPPPLDGVEGEPQPYLDVSPSWLKDPWGNHYQYLCPAQRSKEDFDLWSCGPNGICGDADDICNW